MATSIDARPETRLVHHDWQAGATCRPTFHTRVLLVYGDINHTPCRRRHK